MLVYTRVLDEGAPEAFVLSGDNPTVADLIELVGSARSAQGRVMELDLTGAVGAAHLADLGVQQGDLIGVRAVGEPVIDTVPPQKPELDVDSLRPQVTRGKRLNEYEETTQLLQWHAPFHIKEDRPSHAVWTDDSTALRCSDWEAYRSPDKLYYRTYTTRQARAGRSVATAFEFAEEEHQLASVDPRRVAMMREVVGALQYPDWGLCVVHQHNTRFALSSWIAGATSFMMFDELRHAQMYGRLALAYGEHFEGFEDPRPAWMENKRFQPTRRLIEEMLANLDWGKAIILSDILVEPLHTAAARALLTTGSLAAGDALTPFVCRSIEDDKVRHRESAVAFLNLVCNDEQFGAQNRKLVADWCTQYLPRAHKAARSLAGADVDPSENLDEALCWIREELELVGIPVADLRAELVAVTL
jgi:hypothetical protein